jgi:N,N-dimethylformamidase beta subunit-like protein
MQKRPARSRLRAARRVESAPSLQTTVIKSTLSTKGEEPTLSKADFCLDFGVHLMAILAKLAPLVCALALLFVCALALLPPIANAQDTAEFVRLDALTKGDWSGIYGRDGFEIFNDQANYPSDTSISLSGAQSYTWSPNPVAGHALRRASGSGRIAACQYGQTIEIQISVSSATKRQVALYLVDWDRVQRSATIDVLSGSGQTILPTRTVASFSEGIYLVWNITGTVRIRLTSATTAANIVVSGIFFDPPSDTPSAQFIGADRFRHGYWKGVYGADGQSIANDSVSLPAYASLAVSGAGLYTWEPFPNSGRALQRISSSNGQPIASTWFGGSFFCDISISGSAQEVAAYFVDWDRVGRVQMVTVLDGNGAQIDQRTLSDFGDGIYLVWRITGTVRIVVSTLTQSANAVLSGVFLGSNETKRENALNGTTEWRLSNPSINREIEGYASLTSVNVGGTIDFYVRVAAAAQQATTFRFEIFRMGWYQGLGARRVYGPETLPGQVQTESCPEVEGAIDCSSNATFHWDVSRSLTIPSGPTKWTSGVYVAKLTDLTPAQAADQKQSYIIFTVRDGARQSRILFQSSVTTWQAYNNWGGKSHYKFNSLSEAAADIVSFNRPYAIGWDNSESHRSAEKGPGVGAGEFITNVQPGCRLDGPVQRQQDGIVPCSTGYQNMNFTEPAGWEYPMVRWLEREGYDVGYVTNLDLDVEVSQNPLQSTTFPKLFLSVGHDEYWSTKMRNNVDDARDVDVDNAQDPVVSLGFFSANTCWAQIETVKIGNETEARRFGVNKRWADETGREEQKLLGVMCGLPGNPDLSKCLSAIVNLDIVLKAPNQHWIYEFSGVSTDHALSGLLGYEVDHHFSGFDPDPTKYTVEIVATSTYPSYTSIFQAPHNSTYYGTTASSGVFAAGTIQWSWGLDDEYMSPALRQPHALPEAQVITRNILGRLLQ